MKNGVDPSVTGLIDVEIWGPAPVGSGVPMINCQSSWIWSGGGLVCPRARLIETFRVTAASMPIDRKRRILGLPSADEDDPVLVGQWAVGDPAPDQSRVVRGSRGLNDHIFVFAFEADRQDAYRCEGDDRVNQVVPVAARQRRVEDGDPDGLPDDARQVVLDSRT